MQHHYNVNRRQACVKRPTRSLETKWGIIKHDVAKFCGNYSVVSALCELRTSNEDTFQTSLKLYNIKHSHGQSFTFFHCWLIFHCWHDGLIHTKNPKICCHKNTSLVAILLN